MRGTPFDAQFDNYLFTYSEMSASIADGTFVQKTPGCPDNTTCVRVDSASLFIHIDPLFLSDNLHPTWKTVYDKRRLNPTSASLTVT